MPRGLKRYHQTGDLHFLTFSCYRRKPKLGPPSARFLFEQILEQTRAAYGFRIIGYVVMPEHVHLLVSEPASASLATALQALKQSASRRLPKEPGEPFWQARYYDFNVHTPRKRLEKLHYMHQNPVTRELVNSAQDWPWSSFLHHAAGVEGNVEIESDWTARKRERMGVHPTVRINARDENPRPSCARTGHPQEC